MHIMNHYGLCVERPALLTIVIMWVCTHVHPHLYFMLVVRPRTMGVSDKRKKYIRLFWCTEGLSDSNIF